MENSLTTEMKQQVEDFLTDTADARFFSERDRDYYDHKQWTASEEQKIKSRGQAPVVINRVKPKVEGLIGLYNLRKVDPKAYARTKKHEKSSHAITDALRYVADSVDFNTTKMECANDFWVEGTCGVIIDVKQKKTEIEIRVARIPWDRIYYDTHSRALDFEDARFKGFMMWMGTDQVKEMFPDSDAENLLNATETSDETFEDRPRWQDKKRKRVRLAYHFYIKEGKWHFCIFSGDTFLVEPQVSPFLDDDGEPCCPMEFASANIDRENNRYGEVRAYISSQDEINHRRSKSLFLLSARQTTGRNGAVDIDLVKRELKKPDGHVPYNGEKGDFDILQTNDMAEGQFLLYQDAKAELDAVGMNAQLAGERQKGDLSGRAIDRLQQAGTIELNRQYSLLTNWEKKVYRQIWARIKQFWTEEKWIRVTDDEKTPYYVGLNANISAKEWMEDQIQDESLPYQKRKQLAASYQFLMQIAQGPDPMAAQAAQATLDASVEELKNPVPEIDMDIILDQSFDVRNTQEEQFEMLAKFASSGEVDFIDLLEVSQIPGKDALIEKIEKRRAERAQATGDVMKMQAADMQAKTAKTVAEAQVKGEEATQKRIENVLLTMTPMDKSPQVVV